jgi:hypothetical protein
MLRQRPETHDFTHNVDPFIGIDGGDNTSAERRVSTATSNVRAWGAPGLGGHRIVENLRCKMINTVR